MGIVQKNVTHLHLPEALSLAVRVRAFFSFNQQPGKYCPAQIFGCFGRFWELGKGSLRYQQGNAAPLRGIGASGHCRFYAHQPVCAGHLENTGRYSSAGVRSFDSAPDGFLPQKARR